MARDEVRRGGGCTCALLLLLLSLLLTQPLPLWRLCVPRPLTAGGWQRCSMGWCGRRRSSRE